VTTEAHNSAVPDDSGEFPRPDNPMLFFALMWTLLCVLSGSETPVMPAALRVPYLIALAAPFALVASIALRRRFFPAQMPPLWSKGSPVMRRMQALTVALMGLGILSLAISYVVRRPAVRHDPHYLIPHAVCYFLLGWGYLLSAYIGDRKPLPPPGKHEPIWADMKPISSDHWGEPAQR